MDEARAVLDRLGRIDALERADELRALVQEAELWARREDSGAALDAVGRARSALEEVHQAV